MATQYSSLTDACLTVHGADAGKFLHAQLSYAVDTLDATRAPLAGWHDARGRVRALVRVWRLRERFVLVTPRDGADALLEKLKRFVLRAAVTLELANDLRVAAVLEPDAAWLAQRALPADTPPNRVVSRGDLAWTRIGENYWQALGAPTALAPLAAALPAAGPHAAALAEIRLGIPAVTAALSDRFVAQALSLDVLGALSFTTGCYPGQEVIARVHNLGDVKRHLRRYAAPGAALEIGAEVVGADGKAVGEVVRSAAATAGCELLAVVDDAAAGAPLAVRGVALTALELPPARA